MRTCRITVLILCCTVLGTTASNGMIVSELDRTAKPEERSKFRSARRVLNTEFDPAVEARLAVSAAPAHLRAGAEVYVYRVGTGYELHREGTNGFTCLLNRDAFIYASTAFKPTCWDRNGRDSYVRVMLAVGEWLAAGNSTAKIRAKIDEGFEDGRFRSPTKAGVAYMIAGDLQLDTDNGDVLSVKFPGHYMFYAIDVTSADLGATDEALAENYLLPRVFAGGAGGKRLAYIITMVGLVD